MRQLSSAKTLPRGLTAEGHLATAWPAAGGINPSFLRKMLGSPSQHAPPWNSLLSKVHRSLASSRKHPLTLASHRDCFSSELTSTKTLWQLLL